MEVIAFIFGACILHSIISYAWSVWDAADPQSKTNPRPRRVQFVAIPMLLPWQTEDISTVFLQEIELFRGGGVRLGNQFFRKRDAIDITFPGGEAYRKKWSNELTVTVTGPDPEVYRFKYKLVFPRGLGWFRLVRRYK